MEAQTRQLQNARWVTRSLTAIKLPSVAISVRRGTEVSDTSGTAAQSATTVMMVTRFLVRDLISALNTMGSTSGKTEPLNADVRLAGEHLIP